MNDMRNIRDNWKGRIFNADAREYDQTCGMMSHALKTGGGVSRLVRNERGRDSTNGMVCGMKTLYTAIHYSGLIDGR